METPPEIRKIEVDQQTLNSLNTTRKWTMFLAIIGFIFLSIMIIIGAITGTFLSAFNSGEKVLGITEISMVVIFLVMAVVYFFPVLFLFRFSKHTAHAVQTLDKQELNEALKYLKLYFVYIGVLIIIALALYVVALIVAGTSMPFIKGS